MTLSGDALGDPIHSHILVLRVYFVHRPTKQLYQSFEADLVGQKLSIIHGDIMRLHLGSPALHALHDAMAKGTTLRKLADMMAQALSPIECVAFGAIERVPPNVRKALLVTATEARSLS